MKLSVIIPCLNGSQTISVQLEALAHQEWSEPWEIIFADNGSTDRTLEIVQSYQERLPNLRIVDASARRGQPYALNVGVRAATGESLAFCDADDEVGAGWLAAIGEALSRYDFVACRCDTEKLNVPWVRASRPNVQQKGLFQTSTVPPHAGGGTLGIKRALYEAIGGVDESLPVLHDTDLCWRLHSAGVELHFVQDAVLHIRFQDTYVAMYRQACAWGKHYVMLCREHGLLGTPGFAKKATVRKWIKLVRSLPWQIRSRAGRARWIWQFGWLVGRLHGDVKYRVLAS
jgi:glycosyltransferase involved in cell wall biosynthesis